MRHTLCTTVFRSPGILLILLITLLFSPKAEAQTTYTWAAAAATSWCSTGNWSPAAIPGSPDIAKFNSNTSPTAGAQISINLNAGPNNNGANSQIVGAIYIASPRNTGITLGNSTATNGTLVLNGTSLTIGGNSNVILANDCITLTNAFTINQNVGSGTGLMPLLIGSGSTPKIIYTGLGTITLTGNIITVGTTITGSNPLTFLGGGTVSLSGGTYSGANGGILKLSGANTGMTGAIVVGGTTTNSGILQADGLSALAGTTDLTINPYSQLFLGITGTYVFGTNGKVTLNGVGNNVTTTYGLGALKNAAAATFPASIVMGSDATVVANTTLTLSGAVDYTLGQLVKRGTSGLILSGTTTTGSGTNGIIMSEGTLTVNSGHSIGGPSGGPLTFAQVSGVTTGTTVTISNNQILNSLSSSWATSLATTTNTLIIPTGVTVSLTQSSTTTFGDGQNNTNKNILSGAGAIVKSGSGTLNLTSGNHNHTGSLTVSNGSLIFAQTAGTSTIGSAAVTLTGGTITLSPAASSSLTFGSGGIKSQTGGNLIVTNSGTTTLGPLAMAGGSITVTGNSAPVLGSATISISGGALKIVSGASTTVSLGATAITLSGGSIDVSGSSTTTLGPINVGTGSTAAFTNTAGSLAFGNFVVSGGTATISNTAAPVTGAASVSLTGGTLTIAPGASTSLTMGSTSITLSGGALNVAGSATTTLGNIFFGGGSGTFTNTGGSLALGNLTLSGGSVTISGNTAPITGANTITIATGRTLSINSGASTILSLASTSLTCAGTLFLTGSSTTTLAGLFTMASGGVGTLSNLAPLTLGNVVVSGGALSITNSSTVTGSSVTISSGSLNINSGASTSIVLGGTTITGTLNVAGSSATTLGNLTLLGAGAANLANSVPITVGNISMAGSSSLTISNSTAGVFAGGSSITLATTGTLNLNTGSSAPLAIGGTSVTLNGGTISLSGSSPVTLGAAGIAGTTGTTNITNSASSALNVGNIALAGATISITNNANFSEISSGNSISISSGALKLSSGAPIVLGSNGITLSGGSIQAVGSSALTLGAGGINAGGTSTLTIGNSGIVNLGNIIQSSGTITLAASSGGSITQLAGTNSITLSTGTLRIAPASGSSYILGDGSVAVSGGAISISGSGTGTFGNGGINMTGGIMNVANSAATTLGDITVATGATCTLAPSSSITVGDVVVSGGVVSVAGASGAILTQVAGGNTISVSSGTLRIASVAGSSYVLGDGGIAVSGGTISITGTGPGTLGNGGINMTGGNLNVANSATTTLGSLSVGTGANSTINATAAGILFNDILVSGGALTISNAVVAGTLSQAGSNPITITGGTMRLTPAAGTFSFANNGISVSNGNLVINPAFAAGLTIGGSITLLGNGSLSLTHNSSTTLSNIVVSGANATLTESSSATLTIGSLKVSGSSSSVTLSNLTTTFQNGAFNLSDGITTIIGSAAASKATLGIGSSVSLSGGLLNLNMTTAGAAITLSGGVKLDNAAISFAGTSVNSTITGASVTLINSSTITLGTTGQLKFAASSANSWNTGATITVYGWSGSFTNGGATTTSGKLFFGTSASDLGATNLNTIKFVVGGITYDALQLSTGEVVPKATLSAVISSPAAPYYNDVNNNLSVSYTYTGPTVAPGTVYTVEVSSVSGVYTAPLVSTTTTVSPVSVFIPSLTPVGSYYLRVTTSTPASIIGSEVIFNLVGHPPVVTSLSAYRNLVPGQILTITGSNFNAVSSLNTVYFGSIGVTPGVSSTITSLSVTVPAGASYDYVTVLDKATHLSANSPKVFMPDFENSFFTSTFNTQDTINIATQRNSSSYVMGAVNTVSADFDGDGDMDIVAVTGNLSPTLAHVIYYTNNGANGTADLSSANFTLSDTLKLGGFLGSSMKVGDFDGDGKPDIALASNFGSTIGLLRNSTTNFGAGATSYTFESVKFISLNPNGLNPQSLQVADIDKDGKLDIVVGSRGTADNQSKLVILKNNCTLASSFSTSSFTATYYTSNPNYSATSTAVTTGDFDNDGDIDVALVDQSGTSTPSTITLFENLYAAVGDINFSMHSTLTADKGTTDVAAGDFDNDGNIDIVATNNDNNTIVVYQNSGAFAIATTPTLTLSGGALNKPSSIALADMNGDGKVDMVINSLDLFNSPSDRMAVYLNMSSGSTITFASPVTLYNGGYAYSTGLTIADVDKDKYPDMIISNSNNGRITIIRNKPIINMGAINGAPSPLCYQAATTLSYSTSTIGSPYTDNPIPTDLTGVWTSSDPTLASINSSTGVVQGLAAGNPNISYTLTVTGTNISNSSTISLTVDKVEIAPDPTGALCMGATTLPITYAVNDGSPTNYSITYGSAASAVGFVDVSNAVISGAAITIAVPGTVVAGQTYTLSLTVSDGSCVSTPANEVSFSSYDLPVASISASNATPCNNHYAEINFTGTPDATFNYTVDGGSAINETLTSGVFDLQFPHVTANHTYVLVDVQDLHCSNTYNTSVSMNPISLNWVGGVSGHTTDWHQPNNWSCLTVPGDTDHVYISNITPAPELLSDSVGNAYDITLLSGATLTLNSSSTLHVKDSLINNGSVNGVGTLVLDGSSAQVLDGIGSINNLTLNNSAGAAINTGARTTIKSTLTVTSGNLATNDSLALASDASGSARIAEIPSSGASITGNVRVYQYIQAGYRRFRFWAHPFRDTISLKQLQTYMDITGAGGASNGFTPTASNAPSAFRLDPFTENSSLGYDPGWKAITKINGTEADSNKLKPGQGLRLFMRGVKGENMGYPPYVVHENTLAMFGHVNQGNVSITLNRGSTGIPTNMDFNMVGNPYPSPVNIGAALWAASDINPSGTNNITGAAGYVWVASLGVAGQFLPVDINGSNYFLQANASFQVRAAANNTHLLFTESMKSDTVGTIVFKQDENEHVTLNIYDANYHMWDLWKLRFNSAANDAEDAKYDAVKPSGADFNFYSISADNKRMVIDARPYAADATIPLGISSPYKQDFIIRADDMKLPEGAALFLHDKMLKKYVELTDGGEYKFTISDDKSSQGNERFELALKPAEVVAKNFKVTMAPNPTSDDVKISFTSNKKDNVSVRVMDMSGVTVYTQDLGAVQTGNTTISLGKFASGIYMIELTSGDQKSLQKLVKE